MILLTDATNIRAIKPLSINIDQNKKVTPAIRDAQEFDLRPFLGDELYKAIQDDIAGSGSDYGDLMDETEYTHGGRIYVSPGLRNTCSLFAYARIKSDGNEHDTAFGTVNKLNPYSSGVPEATISRQVREIREQANIYLERVQAYLDRNENLYPLWKKSPCRKPRKTIYKLRSTK